MSLSLDYVLRQTASNLWRNRLMTIAAILTVAVSLSLVGAALILQQGVARAAGVWKGGVELIVFMQPQATTGQIDAVASRLGADKQVKSVRYVDQAQSYQEFKSLFSNQQGMIQAVSPKDLPPSFRIVLVSAKDAPRVGATFVHDPGVRKVAYDQAGVAAMLKVTGVVQYVIVGLAGVLLLSAGVLILNTIRVAIFGRRREVAVMKLVGATNWFIRIPFMLEGLVQGLAGALLAALALFAVRAGVESLIARFQIQGVLKAVVVPTQEAMMTQLLVICVGAVVGMGGSALAVRRFLDV